MSYEPTTDWVSILKKSWIEAGIMPSEDDPAWQAKLAGPPAHETFDVNSAVRQQRVAAFKEMCPQEFQRKIDRALIPNLVAWDEADKWNGTHPGLWLWSNGTGEAKSRMLWRKFGQLHVERGLTILRITGQNLAEKYHDDYNKNRTGEFYRTVTSCDVIMLDDLDKIPLPSSGAGFTEDAHADRNARMLREVFDHLYEQHVPTLVTANESIKFFAERIGASGERRMKAVCNEVQF